MEIGVREGGSIKLWLEYFPEAFVYGIELDTECVYWNLLDPFTRRFVIKFADAYDRQTAESYGNKRFDVIIDDGSHTLDDQRRFIEYYFHLLRDDGVMIIEDVQNIEYCKLFYHCVPEQYRECIKVYDLRARTGRSDDVLFVIDKALKS